VVDAWVLGCVVSVLVVVLVPVLMLVVDG